MSEQQTPDTDKGNGFEKELSRKTVVGVPPKEWDSVRLEEVVEIVSGNSLPTDYQDDGDGEYPVIKVDDMNRLGNEKYIQEVRNRLNKSEIEELGHRLHPPQTVILPKVGAALLTNKRRILTEKSSFDNNIMGWIPEKINPEFLFQISNRIEMKAVAQLGAVPSISKNIANSLKIPIPSLSEQEKIASVLYNVDRAIQKTEEIIRRIKQVKKGVMQDLFTEGYFEHEEFEGYIEGKIPKNWDRKRFGNLLRSTRNGIYKSEDHYGFGTPILKMGDMFDDLEFTDLPEERLELTENEKEKYSIKKEDLLFARRSLNVEGAGKCTLIGDLPEEMVFESSMIRARLKKGVKPEFFAQYFNSPIGEKNISRIVMTLAASGIRGSDLKNLKVPMPEPEEQKKIADVLFDYDHEIEKLEEEKKHLQLLKKGLMQDLLTGEVLTKDKPIEVLEEVKDFG